MICANAISIPNRLLYAVLTGVMRWMMAGMMMMIAALIIIIIIVMMIMLTTGTINTTVSDVHYMRLSF